MVGTSICNIGVRDVRSLKLDVSIVHLSNEVINIIVLVKEERVA